jgi:endonuclease-3
MGDAMRILDLLKREYPGAATALAHRNALEMLIATMLSAQTTDAQVNRVTPALFGKYKTVGDYATAELRALQNDVRSVNFYKNKARNIRNACRMIAEQFNGKVPQTMEELLMLPGVARKTANIVLYNAYGKSEGIAIDTHAKRVSYRLGLTKSKEPERIEQDLMRVFPRSEWGRVTNLLIAHGRSVCVARSPRCEDCVLNALCPTGKNVLAGKVDRTRV